MSTDKKVVLSKDAITLLNDEHKKIQKAFKDFERLKKRGSIRNKLEIVRQACIDLKVHALIEEEIFYPAVCKVIGNCDFLLEARVEHMEANNLIVQLDSMKPGDELYNAKFSVLGKNINRHIMEEESVMFPLVNETNLDLIALGDHMALRKDQLLSEMGFSNRRTQAAKSVRDASEARLVD
ncbi:MAG TPA: hemerythrin domain-containing protein [Gammaproteobacteria bacterium]|nr:hemerythrin domain-containing protein [Gammaproteobacteria bacterium]